MKITLKIVSLVVLLGAIAEAFSLPVEAQIAPTPNDAGTLVNQTGNRFDITGGTQAGSNLFHSFQQFGLSQGQIANFLSNPSIQNILGRVTGGEASVINGLIQVTGGNSSLYLMNPAGIVFGAQASLNVPGSFTATTANGVGFGCGNAGGCSWFSATGANNYAALVGTPGDFGFTTLQPGAIVNAGNLSVGQGQSLTLVGGTVISTGTITAPGGSVTIAAVPGESLVRISQTGNVLSLDLPTADKAAINSSLLSPLSLPALLTGGNLTTATGTTVENGVVKLTSSGLPVQAGDVVAKTVTAGTVTLSASHNLTLVESQIRTTGDLQLLAQNTVRVRDSLAAPVIVQAGGNLKIQGNQAIDLLALNHPTAAFQSGGSLTLVSDGIISGDAHFAAGNGFSIQNLAGNPGNFISLYDPIISVTGDVTFGDYTGVSLKVEATGSITAGNITITNSDFGIPAGTPDRDLLRTYSAVILRAGVATLQETTAPATSLPPSPFNEPVSNTNFTASTASGGNVTVGTAPGTDSISASVVDISATGNILVYGPINGGSYTKLTSTGGDITIHSLQTANVNSFNPPLFESGDIDITAAGLFRATGTIRNNYSSALYRYAQDTPDVLPFLVGKTGATPATLTTAINAASPFTVQATVPAPVSIYTYLGNITIRYAGGAGPGTTLASKVTLQGGNAPFVIGPKLVGIGADPYVPSNPANNYANFVAAPFSLTQNATYGLITIPNGSSGTVGAIARVIAIDGSLTLSLQDRVIGTLPSSNPPPTPQQQVESQPQSQPQVSGTEAQAVQRQFISPNRNAECNPGTGSSSATTPPSQARGGGGGKLERPSSATSNPCNTSAEDAQILKILDESPTSVPSSNQK